MSDNKERRGLLFEVVASSEFFKIPEKNKQEIIDIYRQKYGTPGPKQAEALAFLSEGRAANRRDGRTAIQYLYDMCAGWLKEDLALLGINNLMPKGIYGVLCGHDSNREIKSSSINSGPDFEFKNSNNGNSLSVQFKVTRNLPNYLRIKKSDMTSGSYNYILFFREDTRKLYYLSKDEIHDCMSGYDDRHNQPTNSSFRDEWKKEVYYVPRETIEKNAVGLYDFIKYLVYKLEQK